MLRKHRVEWSELRPTKDGCFLVIAEESSGVWMFFERSTWEIRWYEVPSTPELRAKVLAEQAMQEHTGERRMEFDNCSPESVSESGIGMNIAYTECRAM